MLDFDMETTMRINNLARELLKSGAASSSGDAHMKAEQIIMAESRMKKPEAVPSRSQQVTSAPITGSTSAPAYVSVSEQRSVSNDFDKLSTYDERILRDTSMIKAKLDELQKSVNALSGLSKDIEALKSFISMNSRQAAMASAERSAERASISQSASQQGQQQTQQPIQQAQTSQPTQSSGQPDPEKKSMHPRCGGYSSNDVAIDKIFYSGTK